MSNFNQSPENDLNELLSDESSFYGDETEQSRLEDIALSYDPEPYWSNIHPHLLSTIQHDVRTSLKPKPTTRINRITTSINTDLETEPRRIPRNARGSNEPVSDFACRLTPSTTKTESVGPWIFVSNPTGRSGPDDETIATLVREGTKLLHQFEDDKAQLEAEHDKSRTKSKVGLTRKLNTLRRSLEEDVFALARETGIVSGKWMLFLTANRVDAYWEAIANATVEGDLGVAAKVATDDGKEKARLVAIYTQDYADKEDVKRVLERLVELDLVKPGEKPIYYKCDAFTHLRIMGNNPYGLKASMFSSRDVLGGRM